MDSGWTGYIALNGYWNGSSFQSVNGPAYGGFQAARMSFGSASSAFMTFDTASGPSTTTTFSYTERMRITNSGNVGIGTTSPGSALHTAINSATATTIATFENLNTTTTTAKSFSLQFYGNGAGGQKDAGAITMIPTDGNFGYSAMAFSVRGPFSGGSESVAEVMRCTRTGNNTAVGIGTASPGYTLDVGSFGVDGGTIRIVSSSSCAFRMMEANDSYGFSFTNVAASRMSIKRHSASVAGTEIISIMRDNPYVGIGTTSPSQPLDVNGAVRVRGNLYNADGTQGYLQMNVGTGTIPGYLAFYKADNTRVGYIGWQYDTNTLVLSSENGFTGYVVAGNLGVGVSPSYKLDVSGDIRFSGNMYKSGSSSTNSGINLPTSGAGITWGANGSRIYDDGDLRIFTDDHMHLSTSAGEKITIYNGKVGINNTAPGSQFEVTGSMYQQGGNAYLGYDSTNQIFLGSNRTGAFIRLNDDMWFGDSQNGVIQVLNGAGAQWGTLQGYFTNMSTRASKKNVTMFDQTKLESLYQDTIKTKVCSWHYKEEADYIPLKYGPILDDSPPYFTVTPDGESLYINQYVAMLHGALQVAIQKIESLETRVASLENNSS
jgi:hypothetical protein